MKQFYEIKPGVNIFKKAYLSTMLWFVGRAIQASAKVDDEVRREFDSLPDGFRFSLEAVPDGPSMVIHKDGSGQVSYVGTRTKAMNMDVRLAVKHMEFMFLMFTFRESTPVSNARDRMCVEGNLPEACTVVRILNIVEVYLLPKFIAKLAIKRYPVWDYQRHVFHRSQIYFRTLTGI